MPFPVSRSVLTGAEELFPSASPSPSDLIEKDISMEEWREYEYGGEIYRIINPQTLYIRKGVATHRVRDAEGIMWLIPAPGHYGCVLRWKNKPGFPACSF